MRTRAPSRGGGAALGPCGVTPSRPDPVCKGVHYMGGAKVSLLSSPSPSPSACTSPQSQLFPGRNYPGQRERRSTPPCCPLDVICGGSSSRGAGGRSRRGPWRQPQPRPSAAGIPRKSSGFGRERAVALPLSELKSARCRGHAAENARLGCRPGRFLQGPERALSTVDTLSKTRFPRTLVGHILRSWGCRTPATARAGPAGPSA